MTTNCSMSPVSQGFSSFLTGNLTAHSCPALKNRTQIRKRIKNNGRKKTGNKKRRFSQRELSAFSVSAYGKQRENIFSRV